MGSDVAQFPCLIGEARKGCAGWEVDEMEGPGLNLPFMLFPYGGSLKVISLEQDTRG